MLTAALNQEVNDHADTFRERARLLSIASEPTSTQITAPSPIEEEKATAMNTGFASAVDVRQYHRAVLASGEHRASLLVAAQQAADERKRLRNTRPGAEGMTKVGAARF